jgi:hypothetical protein
MSYNNFSSEYEVEINTILDPHCTHRIKPHLLRDIKTEALLVFQELR